MTVIHFHSLERAEKERAICRLAHTYYEAGSRVLVLVGTEKQADAVDALLWTNQQASFVPHRVWRDGGAPGMDKVLIAMDATRPEGFNVLLLAAPVSVAFLREFAEAADFAEKYDPALLAESRKRYKAYQAAGFTLKFNSQDLAGAAEADREPPTPG